MSGDDTLRGETFSRVAEAVLLSPAEAIIYADRDGVIRYWNAGAERVFGFPAVEAIGQSLDIIIPERQRARHWDGYRRTVNTGESRYGAGDLLAVPALRQDGARISIEFTIVPVMDDTGGIAGLVAILRDVTARFEEVRRLKRELAACQDTRGMQSNQGAE